MMKHANNALFFDELNEIVWAAKNDNDKNAMSAGSSYRAFISVGASTFLSIPNFSKKDKINIARGREISSCSMIVN